MESNNTQLSAFLFIALSVLSCNKKVNSENIFIRNYPTQVNDYDGIKNIFIDNNYIFFQENNFICDQTFLRNRLLLNSEKDSINLILSQINSEFITQKEFKKNDFYADFYYIINLTIDNESKQVVIFQDEIPKEFKTLIDYTTKICQRGNFETLKNKFSNMNMNTIYLISNQNDTLEISALNSFLLWKKLNMNNVCFNFINYSDTINFDYEIPILYNLDCEKEFINFKIKNTELFIENKENQIFHLTGNYSFLLNDSSVLNFLNEK